jgi:hypothetical protein
VVGRPLRQRGIKLLARRIADPRVALKRRELVFGHNLRLEQEPADEGRFAIIDRARVRNRSKAGTVQRFRPRSNSDQLASATSLFVDSDR